MNRAEVLLGCDVSPTRRLADGYLVELRATFSWSETRIRLPVRASAADPAVEVFLSENGDLWRDIDAPTAVTIRRVSGS